MEKKKRVLSQTPFRTWMQESGTDIHKLVSILKCNKKYLYRIIAGTTIPSLKLARQIQEITDNQVKISDILKI